MKYLVQASVAVLAVGAVWVTARQTASAQNPVKVANASVQAPPPPAQGFPRAGMQQQPFGGQFAAIGAGAATMQIDGKYLYIVRGPMMYKVDKNDLKVVKSEMLPNPGGPGPRGGFRPGQGAGGPPPPIND